MRLLNRKEFFEQPPGILYRKQLPGLSWEDIEIKADNCYEDFVSCMFVELSDDAEMDLLTGGKSRPIETEYYGRDGCFEQDAMFWVFETWDLQEMKRLIDKAIEVAPKQIFQDW